MTPLEICLSIGLIIALIPAVMVTTGVFIRKWYKWHKPKVKASRMKNAPDLAAIDPPRKYPTNRKSPRRKK